MTARREHLSWVIPLVAAIASWLGIVALAMSGHTDDLIGLAMLPLFGVLVAGLVISGRAGWHAWRQVQRGHGHLTRREAAARSREVGAAEAWDRARVLASGLAGHKQPMPLTVWGLVLRRDETAHLDLHAAYRRLDGHQAPRDVRIIVTNQRLLCEADTEWQSFWYESITGFYPDLDHWAVTLDFADAIPLQLAGTVVPMIAVYVTERLYGPDGVTTHPGLEQLRRGRG